MKSFICPKCQSSHYDSSPIDASGEKREGHCHGLFINDEGKCVSCRFSWDMDDKSFYHPNDIFFYHYRGDLFISVFDEFMFRLLQLMKNEFYDEIVEGIKLELFSTSNGFYDGEEAVRTFRTELDTALELKSKVVGKELSDDEIGEASRFVVNTAFWWGPFFAISEDYWQMSNQLIWTIFGWINRTKKKIFKESVNDYMKSLYREDWERVKYVAILLKEFNKLVIKHFWEPLSENLAELKDLEDFLEAYTKEKEKLCLKVIIRL